MSLRESILRELITEYQKEKNPLLFEKILRRTDSLLLYIIYSYTKRRSFIACIDLCDLYHTAIIGLYKACITMKEEKDYKIIARIEAYVKCELKATFATQDAQFFSKHESLDSEEAVYTLSTKRFDSADKNANTLDLISVIKRMLIDNSISQSDLDLIKEKFLNGKTYKVLSEQYKGKRTLAAFQQDLKIILEKIRKKLKDFS